MQKDSLKTLAVVTSLFFFTSSLSGSFLPVYFHEELGLSIAEIVEILLFTFPLIGLLPLILLKSIKNFERIISYGIFLTMLFYIILILIKNPIILGLAYGLSLATFWPSFNLLQFRLGETHVRARTVSLFSSIIPSLTSIIGPAIGGFIIEKLTFTMLFAIVVSLYLVVFFLSLHVKYQLECHSFSIPKSRLFIVFFTSFVVLGFSEAYWLAYPLFVLNVSGTVLNMGLVLALSAVVISAAMFLVSWLSDIKKTRVNFALAGALLNALWFFVVSYVSTTYEIVVLSLLSGLAGAFSISWFAHYGDSFSKEHYASILVLMETGMMFGRLLNLVPTYVFMSTASYANYFRLLGVATLFLIPIYVFSKRK
ncbi:MAG TPA: MFS transporter [Candidatus Bathyarchaeia archaeon]|nr:MFS transporter [Candidatus Bathyarchaeia archaeon]